MNLISLKDVWLKYRIDFKENNKVVTENFWAIKGINIDIDRGEVVGIIGENGAGKTTTLKIIAGMLTPDKGTVEVKGTVSALMEIGAGFQKDLTGRENIFLISSLFGLSKGQIEERYDDIIKFAAIGRFINAPVRNYSQGMYMRLAFAIAIHIDPDVLLIDDIFSVGDVYAQRKCINKMFELKEEGKTIIFVAQDIETAQRLCDRGIFIRNGEIVKAGSIEEVCSYYMESVGDKNGIAIIQKEDLGIIFNNGRLILRWKGKTVTCDLSGHAIMSLSGREYLSTTANWQVQECKGKEEISMVGRWPDLPLRQHWKIHLFNEREFIWEISMDIFEEVSIEKFRTPTIFIDKFIKWFTLTTETDFPENFIHLREWDRPPLKSSFEKMVGLKGNSDSEEALPTIIFDRVHDNMEMLCYAGNTGAEINGRAFICEALFGNQNKSYTQGSYRFFTSKIRIFESEEKKELDNYLKYTKEIMQESKIIRKDSLSLFCKEHAIEVYWRDKLVTENIGLDAKFRYQDKLYSTQEGRWNINKEGKEEIVISISWLEAPQFIQIWRLGLKDNNIIVWEIDMQIYEPVEIRHKETRVVLSGEYREWVTEKERGDFERLDKQGSVVLDKYINDYIGVEAVYNHENNKDCLLPGIALGHDDEASTASYIFKINEKVSNTVLRYLEIESEKNLYTSPGLYRYFSGEIRIIETNDVQKELIGVFDKKPSIINRKKRSSGKIEYNRTSLIFDYGKARLFWKEIELTKGLGLYSSILSLGMWYDSSQAFWEIHELEKERFIALGRWPGLSMEQTWEISLLNERNVSWRIVARMREDIILEKEQVKLMLSDRYKEWFTDRHIYGKFPEGFNDYNGLYWDMLWCGGIGSTIGVKKRRLQKSIFKKEVLPSIVFSCLPDSQVRYGVIENTDNLFQARALQYELDFSKKSTLGNDKYFDGRIKIID